MLTVGSLPLPVAIALGILFIVAFVVGLVLALMAKKRVQQLQRTPLLTPGDLGRGMFPHGTHVQLAGVAMGQVKPAPWSGKSAIAWQHYTVTISESEDDQGRKTETSGTTGYEESAEPWSLVDNGASVPIVWPPGVKPGWEAPAQYSRQQVDEKDRSTRYMYVEHVVEPSQRLVLIGRIQGSPTGPMLALDTPNAAITISGAPALMKGEQKNITIGLILAAGAIVGTIIMLVVAFATKQTPLCPTELPTEIQCCMPGIHAEGDAYSIRTQRNVVVQISPRDSAVRLAPMAVFEDGRRIPFERGATGYVPITPTGQATSFRVRDAEGKTPTPYCLYVR